MWSSILNALCRMPVTLSISSVDVSDEKSNTTFPSKVQNISQSALWHAWNAWCGCAMDVKENVVAMWSDPCVLPVCQWDGRAVISLHIQYKSIADGGLPLKGKCVSTPGVF